MLVKLLNLLFRDQDRVGTILVYPSEVRQVVLAALVHEDVFSRGPHQRPLFGGSAPDCCFDQRREVSLAAR